MTSVSALRQVGRYEILREIGRGGTAVVYLARQTDLDRDVALKELAAFHASDPAFVERFLRESRLTGSLNHPNIVTVHEYFENDGVALIAMEFFERGSLRPHVGELALPQVLGVLEGVLAGLAHAETRGIVHRDLKPENVMLTSSGGVKIADFGMAKALEVLPSHELTASGMTVGTPSYMAPEQALGKEVGPSTDLYSVGVLAYEMLAGAVPFDPAEVPMAIMLRHVNEPIPPLQSVKPDVDSRLASWVERMLAKDPKDRPRGATDAWDDLEEIAIGILGPRWRRKSRLTTPAISTPSPPTTVTEALPQQHTRRGLNRTWPLAALVGALLVSGGAVAAAVLSEDSAHGRTTELSSTTSGTTTTTLQPARGPVVSGITAKEAGEAVAATMRLTGPRLSNRRIAVRDGDIADGRAVFELHQKGITANTRGGTYGPVTLRVRKGRNLVRVDVTTAAGSFTAFRARRMNGHAVVIELEKPAPPPSGNTTTSARTTTTTTTTTTPIIESG
jgi:serine/threonine protein kinase